jgi:Glycosyltransferase family 9 (heptosyltransferase)
MKLIRKLKALAGFSWFFARHPVELVRNIVLCTKCIWQVKIKKRPLVVLQRSTGIGDLLSLLSSAKSLRARHPRCWMVILSPPGAWELAEASALADAASDTASFFHWFVMRPGLRQAYYRPLLPAENSPPKAQQRQLSDEFADALSVVSDPSSLQLHVSQRTRKLIARHLHKINPQGQPVIVIHPGPSWEVKEWPSDHWEALTALIAARLRAIVIKIGRDYYDLTTPFRPMPIANTIDWSNDLTLVQTTALLERASLFVGIDSGPLHIAKVLGIPAIGLFGPTDARLILGTNAYIRTAVGTADCRGCHHRLPGPLHWRSGCPNDIACMKSIPPEAIFAKVLDTLNAKAPTLC